MKEAFKRQGLELGAFCVMLFGIVIAFANVTTGCSLFTSQNAKTALDVVQIACAIENATLADAQVAQVCGIADALIPDLKTLLDAQRAQLAKAKSAGACGPDAGADSGK